VIAVPLITAVGGFVGEHVACATRWRWADTPVASLLRAATQSCTSVTRAIQRIRIALLPALG
jgi:hypothetical protein